MLASRLMAPSEAARLLGVSYKTVNRLFDSGDLRGIRTSLGRLLDEDAVLDEVERRRRIAAMDQ